MALVQTEPKKVYLWGTEVSKIFLWDKQVRPAGWKPWANTVAYYPLNSTDTYYDKSWNNYNLTPYWTPSYTSTYVDLTSGCLKIPNLTYSTCTVSFWCKRNWTQISRALVDMASSDTFIRFWYGTSWYINFQKSLPSWSWEQNLVYDTNRHLYTVTNDSTGCIVYLDGSYKYTLASFGTQTSAWSSIWTGWNGTSTKNPNIYVSNFIIENKARTADEISEYYNRSKANYWL